MKKKSILLYSILIIMIILIVTGAIGIYQLYKEPKVPVLCYHNVGTKDDMKRAPDEKIWTMQKENFEEEMKYLYDAGYRTLTMDEFYEWKKGNIELPLKSILITFDDGYLANYHYAFPILKKYNINATVFLIGNNIRKDNPEWSGNLIDYMSVNLINKCKTEYPNIEFQSHSIKLHKKGSIKDRPKKELEDDAKQFRELIKSANYYAYPFGDYNEKMIEALKKSKYKLAFIYGPNKEDYRKASRSDDDYLIPRLNIHNDMSLLKYKYRLLMPF